jgi:hypothetical protein
MLSKDNFSKQHIDELRAKYKRDPALIERTIYAFGMLEAITQVNLPFIFKGGTCLMLLLNNPSRLSTDIDIIVKPGTDISKYVEAASKIFPFTDYEEQIRKGKNNIEKRHFKFTYVSPITNREIYILLDVLFEENNYAKLIKKEIKNICSKIKTNIISKDNRIVYVEINNSQKISGDHFIIATGGASYPLTGSRGEGQQFAKKLGHSIIDLKPSLVPIELDEDWLPELMGLSLKNISLNLLKNNKSLYKETVAGEITVRHFNDGTVSYSLYCILE